MYTQHYIFHLGMIRDGMSIYGNTLYDIIRIIFSIDLSAIDFDLSGISSKRTDVARLDHIDPDLSLHFR